MKLDELDYLSKIGKVLINDQDYTGSISVGDILEVNNKTYSVLGINEDVIVIKELGVNK